MKKALRALLIAIGVSWLGAVLILGLTLSPVDYTPYYREAYWRETAELLKANVATNKAVTGELYAGFGRAVLTPSIGATTDQPDAGQFRSVPLAGYGNRKGKPATGKHDDLYIKAAALKVGDRIAVMIAADALIIPREVADLASEQLRKELRLNRDQIYFSATHSHSSIGGWGEGFVAEDFAGPFQPGVLSWFAKRLADATRDAVADLKPAEFGFATFSAGECVRNRLVGEAGTTDPEFSFAVIRQTNGFSAVLGSFSAHATVLSGQNLLFSSDYPGAWARAVEQATGGMALFFAGGVGSHSPKPPSGGGFEAAESLGQALAAEVKKRVASTSLTNVVPLQIVGLRVALPQLNVRVSDSLRLRPWLASRLLHVRPDTFLQMLRIGNVTWFSTPCDFSGEMAVHIKNSMRVRGRNAVVTSFNGDYIGYVVPARYYHLNSYESRLMSFFGPNVPDYLDDLIRRLASETSGEPASQ